MMTSTSAENKSSVLDEAFEVQSFNLEGQHRRYASIRDLAERLMSCRSTKEDQYCAASCIMVLSARLNTANETKQSLFEELRAKETGVQVPKELWEEIQEVLRARQFLTDGESEVSDDEVLETLDKMAAIK
jgi:hypothetical protein